MALVRSPETLAKVKALYQSGLTTKDLRSYYLPEYQQEILEILASETGKSRAGVLRTIIDEWYELQAEKQARAAE